MSPRAAWRLESLGFAKVYDYVTGKSDWLASNLPTEGTLKMARIGQFLRSDVPTCSLNDRVTEVQQRARAAGWETCIVVNEQRIVLGLLRRRALEANPEQTVENVMHSGPTTFRPHTPLEEMAAFMQEHDIKTNALVTTPEGELLGVIERADVELAFHEMHEHASAAGAGREQG